MRDSSKCVIFNTSYCLIPIAEFYWLAIIRVFILVLLFMGDADVESDSEKCLRLYTGLLLSWIKTGSFSSCCIVAVPGSKTAFRVLEIFHSSFFIFVL